MISTIRRLVRAAAPLALAIGALLAGARESGAQASTTAGAIRGTIAGVDGRPVSDVTVTVVNEGTGLSRSAISDASGLYVVRLLPPGTYRVTARRLGFAPSEVAGVRVVVAATTAANLTLRETAVALQGVRVTAEAPRVDVSDGGVKQLVSQEEIQNLPTLGRDFTDFINLSGLVSPTPETTTGGQFSIAGQRPSQTNIQIDGVDANNSFFGENRGGSRIPFAFSLESIREFQIITNGYDVEYGNYSGGLVNIVTRGGTNDFKATLYGNIRDSALTRRDFAGNPPTNFSVQQYAGSIEGPIVKDKLFYLFSFDGQRRREPFRSISPTSLGEEARESLAAGDTADFESSLADSVAFERYLGILEDRYGVADAGSQYGNWEISNDVLTLFGRLDWNVNERHRLSIRNNFSTYKNDNEAGNFAVRTGLSQAETIEDIANSFVAEATSSFSDRLTNVFRLQYATEERPRTPKNYLPELRVLNGFGGGTVEFGGAFISFDNNLDERKLQLVDNLTIAAGQHTLKVGTNNTFSSFENRFWLNGSGSFDFSTLDDLENFNPVRYNRNLRADGTAPTAEFDTQEYGVYLQDDWQVTPRLLASVGLRYDNTRFSNAPGRVIDVERAFGFRTGVAPEDNDNVAPRFALTFDRRGDATEVLRAGAGLFYGRFPFALGSNVALTDNPLLVLDCTGSIADGDPTRPPSPADYANWDRRGADNPAGCGGGAGVGGLPEYSFWTTGFDLPETWKFNLGYERLFRPQSRLSVDGLFSSTTKLYTVRNLNLRDAQFTLEGEGGRSIFVPEGNFNPSQTAGTDRLRNTDFSNIYVNYADGVARSFAATVNWDEPLSESSSLRASYTYTWAKDNSSFSCCTSNEGFTGNRYGAAGPNVIGAVGDEANGWGMSNFVRTHTAILSGFVRLPYDFRVTTIWRVQSGTPWGPEVNGDLNADGVRFNDRPYVFAPDELPVDVGDRTGTEATEYVSEQRARYADLLRDFDCIGDFVGQIIPRNTCRQPVFNRLDLSVRKRFKTFGAQGAELQVDLFNVLNGLNSDWGQYRAISGANRNLLVASRYDSATGQTLYTVPSTLGRKTQIGSNLLLQFSAQLGFRYFF